MESFKAADCEKNRTPLKKNTSSTVMQAKVFRKSIFENVLKKNPTLEIQFGC